VATGHYYARLNALTNDRLGGWDIAETLIAGMNFGNIEALLRDGDWDGLSEYMTGKVDGLIAGGADAILCASNTLHKPLAPIMQTRDIPFLHIADPTGAAIRAAGLSRIILLGTAPTMEQDYLLSYYRDQHGVEIITPNAEERAEVDRIIFDELVRDVITDTSKQTYLEIVDRLAKQEGAQGVILGCTEIFLLIQQADRPDLPFFDTTELHCQAAVDFALG
jgi:aspartate racemase